MHDSKPPGKWLLKWILIIVIVAFVVDRVIEWFFTGFTLEAALEHLRWFIGIIAALSLFVVLGEWYDRNKTYKEEQRLLWEMDKLNDRILQGEIDGTISRDERIEAKEALFSRWMRWKQLHPEDCDSVPPAIQNCKKRQQKEQLGEDWSYYLWGHRTKGWDE